MSFALLAQHPVKPDNASQKLLRFEESARSAGIAVRNLPLSFTGEQVQYIGDILPPGPGRAMFSGYIPSWSAYKALEDGLGDAGWSLINSTRDSKQATEIQHWYPLLEQLTAATVFIQSGQTDITPLKYPVFVKGAVKSRKEAGWEACIARDENSLREMSADSAVTVRALLDSKRGDLRADGFPVSREYRFYLLDCQVLGGSYYWGDTDPWGNLTRQEIQDAYELCIAAAQLLKAPLLCVDVVQLQDGSWKIVEVGDPQHSGIAHMPHQVFLQRMSARYAKR